jgi:hypothetical protein
MTPNDDSRDEELLARYRKASADGAAPRDDVRAAIFAESRRVADELAKRAPQHIIDVSRPAANESRWKVPMFGTVGAALLAALLFAPRYWEKNLPAQVSTAPAPASADTSASAAAASQAPKLAEVESYAARPPIAAAPAPAVPPTVVQNYAPVSNSISPLAAAPPAPAARTRPLDLFAQGAVTGGGLKATAGAAAADSALTLQSAAAQGDVAQTVALLDKGAVIDTRDEAGRTPLMLAVTQNRLEIVRLLLARGADPNAADNAGHTPLQQALMRNLRDVAALLEQSGAH